MLKKPRLRKKANTMTFALAFVSVMIASALMMSPVRANPITVSVSPTSGTPGTSVLVSGDDATPYGEVRIYLSVFFVSLFMETTTADGAGMYSVNITVPAITSGSYSVLALDVTADDDASTPFTIETKIEIDPTEGSGNDQATVKGYGFNSVSLITLTFNGTDVTPWPQPQTNEFGSFTTTITIPNVPKGTYEVNASDGTYYALTAYTVFPKVRLSPTSGPPTTVALVGGTGFASSVAVSIEFGNINVTMYPPVPTDADGSFMQVFFVPEVPDGEYMVNATDETGNSATAQFLVPSPTLTLEPSTTTGNSIVTVRGSGFPPYQPILLYVEDNMVVSLIDLMVVSEAIYADEYGVYEYPFIVPVENPGIYKVVAYSASTGLGLQKGEEIASAPLTITENALLLELKDKIATIIIPDLGIIRENLTSIDAKLVELEGTTATISSTLGLIQADISDIQLNVTAINGNIATIETTLGTIEGEITSIEGNTATIETDLGTVITQISDVEGTFTIPLYVGLVLAVIAAAGTVYLVIIHVQAMRKPPE